MQQAFAISFAALLLFGPTLSSHLSVPALLSCPGLFTLLLSCFPVSAALNSPGLPILSLFCLFMLALSSYLFVPALLSSFMLALVSYFVLGLAPTWHISSAFRIFKQVLSDKSLGRRSTNESQPSKTSLSISNSWPVAQKRNCKRPFDIAFITSRLFTANHIIKEIDLSFGKCECPAPVKFNQLWQLELLNRKPVCILKTIFLVAALFWDPLFALCPHHIIKLVSKLGLRTQSIAIRLVKEKIESVWANKTICQPDQLFQNNSRVIDRNGNNLCPTKCKN